MLDETSRLIYVTGFGGITFTSCLFSLVILPLILPKWFKISEWESGPPFILSILLFILTSSGYVFYIHYVGHVSLNLYLLFKIALVCIIPVIILKIVYKNKALERIIVLINKQNKIYSKKIDSLEKEEGEKLIEILSSNKTERLKLKTDQIVLIRSSDNYIEIFFLQKDKLESRLIRNTLKNIENQVMERDNFIRCHRTAIVNINYIDRLIRNYSGHFLKVHHFTEKVPVSRTYLNIIREVINEKE